MLRALAEPGYLKEWLVEDTFFTLTIPRNKKLRQKISKFRGTQRIVSVEYLFGRHEIASNFRLGKCHLELS